MVEVYAKDKPISPAALTPLSIQMATEAYRTPDDTAMVWEGKAYVPSIDRCIRDLGREKVEAMLKMYLIRLNVSTNASRPLTEGVIESMVPVILDHITRDLDVTINLADLKIIFDRAMKGHYGTPYGGFTSQDICGWFDKWDKETREAIDRVEQRRKREELAANRIDHRVSEVFAHRAAHSRYIQEQAKKNSKTIDQ